MGRRHIRLGAATLTLGGAAFGLIQILQGTIGSFSPRPVVTVLLAISVALAGSTLGRLRQRVSDNRLFAGLLRVWPLRRTADTEPLAAGVFPGRAEPMGPYVPRDVDSAIQEALRAGRWVLVVGPGRAGKTRSAFEAARAVLPDRPVVVPTDGPSLSSLAADAWSGFGAEATWWLDDLERFIDHLGGAELAMLLDPRRTVVATVREDFWHTLLRTSGEPGERGRRLLAAAHAIRLDDQLSPAEAAHAERLYPGIDLSGGIGEALAAPDEGAVPVQPPKAPSGGHGWDPLLVLAAGATLVAASALAVVIGTGGFSVSKPPPISAQVDSIRARAARVGETTVVARSESLHGFGQSSYVFVMRAAGGGSDELRVYDEVDGWLRLRLDFRPFTHGSANSPFSVAAPSDVQHGAYDYSLESPLVSDVFGNGERELIFDYAPRSSFLPVRLPLMVAWDDSRQRYEISPLLTGSLPPPGAGSTLDSYLKGAYVLDDVRARIRLNTYAVSSFIALPASGPAAPVLATAGQTSGGRPTTRVAVNIYSLDLTAGHAVPHLLCGSGPTASDLVTAPVTRGGDYRSLLQRLAPTLAPEMTGTASPDGRICLA